MRRCYHAPVIRLAIRFSGRVQGVGFRATARQIAREHTVSGWVRNDADGSVTMEVEGDEGDVDGYLAALSGAMNALISGAERVPIDPVGEPGFEIRW